MHMCILYFFLLCLFMFVDFSERQQLVLGDCLTVALIGSDLQLERRLKAELLGCSSLISCALQLPGRYTEII